MKKNVISLLLIGFLIQSCKDEKTTPDKLTSVPMNVGSEWTYEKELIIKKFESETSDKVIDIDTVRSIFKVLISKDTVLRDSIAVKEFITNEIGSQVLSRQYLKLDKDGLKLFAYNNGSITLFKKKKSANAFINLMINSISIDPIIINETLSDTLYFYQTPRLVIKLPISVNDRWTYASPTFPLNIQIDKEVIGYESVKTASGTFSCYKIRYKYSNSDTFSGIEWYDWISNKGLIKRQIINERVTLITAEDENLGNCQLLENIIVKEMKIK